MYTQVGVTFTMSFVFTTTALTSSQLAPKYTVPAAVVSEFVIRNPFTVPHTAVAVGNVTWAAAEPRPDWVVPAVPQLDEAIVWRA